MKPFAKSFVRVAGVVALFLALNVACGDAIGIWDASQWDVATWAP